MPIGGCDKESEGIGNPLHFLGSCCYIWLFINEFISKKHVIAIDVDSMFIGFK